MSASLGNNFRLIIKYDVSEALAAIQQVAGVANAAAEDVDEAKKKADKVAGDAKEMQKATEAGIRTTISKVRNAISLGVLAVEASGAAVDMSLQYLIEAAVLTVEFTTQLLMVSSVTPGLMIRAGFQMVLIISLMALINRLEFQKGKDAAELRATVSLMRGISLRQTYYG